MKTFIALTIALMTLAPQSAYALTITYGYVTSIHGAAGTWAGLLGDNFNVWAGEESYPDPRPAFVVDPYTWTMTFRAPSVVTVGGQECRANEIGEYCGQITLTSPGLAMPGDWPSTTLFTRMVPFSGTGFLLVGGNRYDISGEGWLTGQRCLDLAACGILVDPGAPPEFQFRTGALLTYTFTVAEPPTLLLTAAFVLTVVGMAFFQRRVVI